MHRALAKGRGGGDRRVVFIEGPVFPVFQDGVHNIISPPPPPPTCFYKYTSVSGDEQKGYVTPVPDIYSDLPQLKGRATVEMTIKRPGGEKFNIEGRLFDEAKMKMIIDGYTGKYKYSPFAPPLSSSGHYIRFGSFWVSRPHHCRPFPPPPSGVTLFSLIIRRLSFVVLPSPRCV